MRPSPYQIAAFTEAARHKSFSRAAVSLGVTQSAVTQHVARLEQTVGTPLFIRRREGLELTVAGRELFAISDRLRTLEQLVVERVSDYGDMAAGQLRIGANAPRPALPLIARFTQQFPQVEISFTLMSWDLAMRSLREREIDIGFVVDPEPDPALVVRQLGFTTYRAFVHVDHPLASRDSISLHELQHQVLVVPEDGSLTQRLLYRWAEELGLTLRQVIETATFPMVKEAVLHGVGVGLMLADGQFPSRNLKALPIIEMQEPHRNCLVIPSDKANLRLISNFAELSLD